TNQNPRRGVEGLYLFYCHRFLNYRYGFVGTRRFTRRHGEHTIRITQSRPLRPVAPTYRRRLHRCFPSFGRFVLVHNRIGKPEAQYLPLGSQHGPKAQYLPFALGIRLSPHRADETTEGTSSQLGPLRKVWWIHRRMLSRLDMLFPRTKEDTRTLLQWGFLLVWVSTATRWNKLLPFLKLDTRENTKFTIFVQRGCMMYRYLRQRWPVSHLMTIIAHQSI
ncbi:unnamed protein product, partial [Brassica oleracea var. botrytis]